MKKCHEFVPLKTVAGLGLLTSAFMLPLLATAQSDADVVVTNNASSNRVLSESEINNAKPHRNPLPPPDTNSVQPARGYSPVELPGAVPGVKGKQDDSATSNFTSK